MTSRKESFRKLRALLDSAESNFDHGRPNIGLRKLAEALGAFTVLYYSLNPKAWEGVKP